jgi:hypothetical protein
VYEVIEKATGVHWAGKVVNKTSCPATALETELAILSHIDHPQTVRLKEVFNSEDVCIIVQELYAPLPPLFSSIPLFSGLYSQMLRRVNGGELFDRSKYSMFVAITSGFTHHSSFFTLPFSSLPSFIRPSLLLSLFFYSIRARSFFRTICCQVFSRVAAGG